MDADKVPSIFNNQIHLFLVLNPGIVVKLSARDLEKCKISEWKKRSTIGNGP